MPRKQQRHTVIAEAAEQAFAAGVRATARYVRLRQAQAAVDAPERPPTA